MVQVKTGHFRLVRIKSGQLGCGWGQVDLDFSHEFFKKKYFKVVTCNYF